nr:DsbA family protein [Escherichia coli]
MNTNASLERIIPYAPALFETKETPNIGPDNAAVAVVEFFDYQCHFCMKVAPVVESVLSQSSDVKFFFKEFPGYRKYKPPFCSSSEVSYLKFPHSFTAQAPILTAGPA